MKPLRVTSIQSDNALFTCIAISQYLSQKTKLAVEFVSDLDWRERDRQINTGMIDIAWICGLPYVQKVDFGGVEIEPIAAPVMLHPRYKGEPVYFSDVIVRDESRFKTFSDLRGAAWAYNEPGSQSGYNLTRYYLARMGEGLEFFGDVTEAGSHLKAIEMVLDGVVDASAIDSTVLELELTSKPLLDGRLRVVQTLGPSPIPPWVISTGLEAPLREEIRNVFLDMHNDLDGKLILTDGQIERMAAVQDLDYDPIRKMKRFVDHFDRTRSR